MPRSFSALLYGIFPRERGAAAGYHGPERSDRMLGRNIIVIGASQGGVRALTKVLARLPADLNAAIFVVLHVGTASSRLAELLARTCRLAVADARDGEAIRAGRVYLATPDHHMILEGGHVRLIRGPKENFARPAIDPLFRSAALAFGARVVGVLLTGQLNDGAAGLLAIKDRGGIAIVQDPREAVAPSMPRAAIACGAVDHVSTLAGIVRLLVGYDPPDIPLAAPPPLMALEHGLSAMESFLLERADLEKLGTPSAFTCPDCRGTLYRLNDGRLLRFRCRAGHAMSALALLTQMRAARENAIWSLIRALSEEVGLASDMEQLQATATETNARPRTDELLLLAHMNCLREMIAEPRLSATN